LLKESFKDNNEPLNSPSKRDLAMRKQSLPPITSSILTSRQNNTEDESISVEEEVFSLGQIQSNRNKALNSMKNMNKMVMKSLEISKQMTNFD
jgi:hypothetical protein